VSFWTDIIAYSPTWVDVYPERVRRFVSTAVGTPLPGATPPEIACFGVHDVNGDARRQAAHPDIDTLLKKLADQAAKAEHVDCEATGVYEPPSWTEMSDTHVGPFISIEGSAARICQELSGADKTPFAELEVVGLHPGKEIVDLLSFSGDETYLEFSELNLEVGPNVATFLSDPPEFAGWLRVVLSGEGQPHPLTKQQLIKRARRCAPLRRIVDYAGECFAVKKWRWTASCKG